MNENIIVKNGKRLRCGYTTGSCAAAASAAAAEMLLSGRTVMQASIILPGGETAIFDIEDPSVLQAEASCSVTKDGGDDPDVTSGLKIFARVFFVKDTGVRVYGGDGVGRVTLKGLQCQAGEAAINPVPKSMIKSNIERIAEKYCYKRGLAVEISVPGGAEAARKTFNPKLGIIGGISILGTTGIVEPMSEKALVDTIKLSIDKRFAENSQSILISPGNYGRKFCMEELGLDIDRSVQISNYVGEALDHIKYTGFEEILLVGHTGKLVKLAAGIMNTHSSYGDCRMEVIAAHSACCGAERETVKKILKCITTDDAFDLIKNEPYFEEVKAEILERALDHLNYRLKNDVKIEVIMFTTDRNNIIASRGAGEMIRRFKEESI